MTEFIMHRQPATGIWRYEFNRNGELFGRAESYVSSWKPTRIEGPGFSWISLFDRDLPMIPGQGRKVRDEHTGEEIYRMIWWGPNLYEIRGRVRSLRVEAHGPGYYFGDPGMPVLAMTEPVAGEPDRLRTVFFDPAEDTGIMAVLAFPVLRFF